MIFSDYIYLGILLSSAFLGFIKFKKCSLTFKLVTIFLFVTFCKETPNTILAYISNNSFLQNIYTPIHVGFFVSIYYTMIVSGKIKIFILYFGVVVFAGTLIGVLSSPMDKLPWILISIDAMMLVIFSILYFYELIKYPIDENIFASGYMWLNASVLIYFTTSFIFWISFPYIAKQDNARQDLLFYILDQLGSVHYFLLLIALYLHIRQQSKNEVIAN